MPRSGTIGNVDPYRFFGTFAGLPFWGGGLHSAGCGAGGRKDFVGRQDDPRSGNRQYSRGSGLL